MGNRRIAKWMALPFTVMLVGTLFALTVFPGKAMVCAYAAFYFGSWHTVQEYAKEHLKLDPRDQRALLLVARSASQLGDGQLAERSYRQIQSLPLEDLRWLSVYYRFSGLFHRQMNVNRSILDLRPDDPNALLQMALLYQQRRDVPTAKQYARQAVKVSPGLLQAWWCLAELHHITIEPDKAAACLREGIAREPKNIHRWHTHLADILISSLNEPSEAETLLKTVLKQESDNGEAHRLLAECLIILEQFEEASKHLDHAVRLEPENTQVLLAYSHLELQHHRNWTASAKWANRVIEQDPKNQQALNILAICRERQSEPVNSVESSKQNMLVWKKLPTKMVFTEVAKEWGITFKHYSGENKQERYLPESFGSGLAIIDYDLDGLMDLYFVNGQDLDPTQPVSPDHPGNQLFRNLGDGHFEEKPLVTGVSGQVYGHGVAVGDYDNDGYQDLYVANYGRNSLFRNTGRGSFVEVTDLAGVGNEGFSTSAAWMDMNQDGNLDLYVCNYSPYDVENPVACNHPEVGKIYCGPNVLVGQADVLYRNNGDGSFSDITASSGIRDGVARSPGKGLGVVGAYLDEHWETPLSDWYMDLFVANDTSPNFVFLGSQSGLTDFTDESGAAFNEKGNPEACMGVDAGDIDGDGDFDVLVTNYWREKNTLYRNEGGRFLDATHAHGLGYMTKLPVGWGTALTDFDNDGDLDNFVTNGDFYDFRPYPMRQRPMLFANQGNGMFEDVRDLAGDYFQDHWVGRGAAFGDLDNDGDTDIVVNHWGEGAAVLRNDSVGQGAWVRFDLMGVQGNRDAVGAALRVQVGTRFFHYQRKAGSSYLSANDPRLTIGLGAAKVIDQVIIRWSSGQVQRFFGLAVNSVYRLIEGQNPEPLDFQISWKHLEDRTGE